MTPALALTLLLAVPASDTGIQWEKRFDRAAERARKQDKPVMAYFWAEWCGFCRRLDRTTYVDPVVGAKAQNFVAVRVDTEGSRRDVEIVKRHEVHSVPTILFLSPRGRQILRVTHYQSPGHFAQTMDRALETARQVMAWEGALESNPDDPAALCSLGEHLFKQDRYLQSYELLARAAAHDAERPPQERRRTRLLLAFLQNVQRQYAEAETTIKEALSIDPQAPDQPRLLLLLGRTYVSWGRRTEGVETMQVIVREHPQSPFAQKARETLVVLERK